MPEINNTIKPPADEDDEMAMSPNLIRAEYLAYIEENENIPDYMKKPLQDIVRQHFQIISATLGNMELVHLRATQGTVELTIDEFKRV